MVYRQNVGVLTGTAALSVDLKENSAKTNTGKTIGFDHLVFTTGSRNRHLPMEGAEKSEKFSVFHFKNNVLIAADAINSSPEFMIRTIEY